MPIQRLKEAVTEIKRAARTDPLLAAEGAVLLIEKLSPALEQVDSSSGALGSAVNRAIDILVPIIAAPEVTESVREALLERLFDALQEDRMPYIEHLGDFWGQLCVTPSIASAWAERLLGTTTRVPIGAVAKACETILLQCGMIDGAHSWPQPAGSILR